MLTIRHPLPVPDASTPDIDYTSPVTRPALTIRHPLSVLAIRHPLSVPDLRRYVLYCARHVSLQVNLQAVAGEFPDSYTGVTHNIN